MANSKMTQKDYFNQIIALATENDRPDLVEFCNSRIALLDKKGGKVSAKRVAEVEANENAVFEALVKANKAITVTELVKTAENAVKDMAPQKVSAYLTKLVKAEKVARVMDKKVALFSVKA